MRGFLRPAQWAHLVVFRGGQSQIMLELHDVIPPAHQPSESDIQENHQWDIGLAGYRSNECVMLNVLLEAKACGQWRHAATV
jgi:hypothetical protein